MVEADESDLSMLKLQPAVALVTNVELDHHATYARAASTSGRVRAVPGPGPAPHRVGPAQPGRAGDGRGDAEVVTFDAPEADLRPDGVRFDWRGHNVALAVPGAHNALNAAAALEACRAAGADLDRAVAALADFRGAGRRFELLGTTASGAAVYDDYAHHPTEVAATIAAARRLEPARVVAVFQPTSSCGRAALAPQFGDALARADVAPSSTSIPPGSGPRISPGTTDAWSPPRPLMPRAGAREMAADFANRRSRCCAVCCAPATCVWSWAPATSTRWGETSSPRGRGPPPGVEFLPECACPA